MKKYENINDVMKELTFLKNVSDGHDEFDKRLKAIAEVLELFDVKWRFIIEENEKFVAKLL